MIKNISSGKIINIIIIWILLVIMFCPFLSSVELASASETDGGIKISTHKSGEFPLTNIHKLDKEKKTLKGFALQIIKFLNLSIAGISLVGIMIGGIMLITASGDDGQIQKGKSVLLYSIIGLVVTLTAYLIVTLVQTALYSLGT